MPRDQPLRPLRRSSRIVSASSRAASACARCRSRQSRSAAGERTSAATAMITVDNPARAEPTLPQCHSMRPEWQTSDRHTGTAASGPTRVQHQNAATRPHLADRLQPLPAPPRAKRPSATLPPPATDQMIRPRIRGCGLCRRKSRAEQLAVIQGAIDSALDQCRLQVLRAKPRPLQAGSRRAGAVRLRFLRQCVT